MYHVAGQMRGRVVCVVAVAPQIAECLDRFSTSVNTSNFGRNFIVIPITIRGLFAFTGLLLIIVDQVVIFCMGVLLYCCFWYWWVFNF